MDANVTLLGFPIGRKKERSFFLGIVQCALVEMAKPDFFKKNFKRERA